MGIVVGFHAVEAALRLREDILSLWVMTGREDARALTLLEVARERGIGVRRVSHTEFNQRAGELRHQGFLLECRRGVCPYAVEDLSTLAARSENKPLFLALDQVQDPHNLGACLRTADGAGVTGLILPKDRSADVNQTVEKVACGAAQSVPIVRVANLANALTTLQKQGVWVIGLAEEADKTIFDLDLTIPLCLVLGNEHQGLRRLTRERSDFLMRIPMLGTVSSLNVSVAAAISLYEAVRQRSVK